LHGLQDGRCIEIYKCSLEARFSGQVAGAARLHDCMVCKV